MPMTAKQIRYFGTPAQKAALRRKRGGSRSTRRATTARRVYSKRTTMPRKTKKGRFGGRKQKQSWSDLAVTANVAIQAAEPFAPAALAAANGDLPGALAAARPALKEATSTKNIAQMAIPFLARAVQKKLARLVGAKSPKVAGRRLW